MATNQKRYQKHQKLKQQKQKQHNYICFNIVGSSHIEKVYTCLGVLITGKVNEGAGYRLQRVSNRSALFIKKKLPQRDPNNYKNVQGK